MKRKWHVPRWPALVLVLALVQIHCVLMPDDSEDGRILANAPPTVHITAGAPSDDPSGVDYKILFRWRGFDPDGEVVAYEWAVDDTTGDDAWQRTTELSTLLHFQATTRDPGDPDSNILTDWHSFFIRAVDNEAAVSVTDVQTFNARTVAPTSEVTFPIIHSGAPEFFMPVLVEWDGEDLDSSQPSRKPLAWETKIVRIRQIFDTDETIFDSLLVADNLLLDSLHVGSKSEWVRGSLAESSLWIDDLVPGLNYAFAVRATDEAGAIEPFLERGRNVLTFAVRFGAGQPRVTMSESSLGGHTIPNDGPVWEVTVPSDRPLHFRWSGNASHYGSRPGRSNYAINIPDPNDDSLEDPNGQGGWIGWGDRTGTEAPIVFGAEEAGQTHSLWVKMRDISDEKVSERFCHVKILVIPFTFDRFALVIDDAKFAARPPTDAMHDAFLSETITRRFYELGQVDHLALYPPSGRIDERTNYVDLPLETLARYQHIFWSVQVGAGNPQPLRQFESEERLLSQYALAGGRLFFGGGRISSYMIGGPNGSFGYPKTPPLPGESDVDFERKSFIWQFMRYRDALVSVPTRGTTSVQKQSSGLVALQSQHSAYPDLQLDYKKRDPFAKVSGNQFRGGIQDWEGVLGRTDPSSQMPGFEALYTPITMDTTLCCGLRRSGLSDAIVGHRYSSTTADTLVGTQQGRMMIFNFQPYWFEAGSLLDAGTAAINWLVTGHD